MGDPSEPRERGGWRHVPALVVSLLFVIPLVVAVAGSLRDAGLPPPRTVEVIPERLAVENYPEAYALVDLPRQVVNSLIVVAFAVPLTVLVASWAGFAISRMRRRAATVVVALSLLALVVPATALLVGRFAVFRTLRLTDTFVPLVAPALIGTSPFYVLLYAWTFRRLPADLFEAARLEGSTPFEQWRRVGMPLAKPVTAAVAALAFALTWGNLLDPLIYLFDPSKYTVPLGLRALSGVDAPDLPL
ncbi:MAG TPA: carbohydrate ABC transporter permease, partial [Actinomycetota bacterium]|nr:carbohydrate ABC transporter permease [Actinomycetota bacterium]